MNGRRTKQQQMQRWNPQDLGLVPPKYLKKKAAGIGIGGGTEATSKPNTAVRSGTPDTVISTPTPTPPPPSLSSLSSNKNKDKSNNGVVEPRRLFLSVFSPSTSSSSNVTIGSKFTSSVSDHFRQFPEDALRHLDEELFQKNHFRNIPRSPYVQHWKLTTLRSEQYHVPQAVNRCIQHWKVKSSLFGTPDLKITIRDIMMNNRNSSRSSNDASVSLVHKGLIQLLPVRDVHDRAVLCVHFQPDVYSSQEREVCCYVFILYHSALSWT